MNWYVLDLLSHMRVLQKLASYSYELSIPFMDWVRETGSFEYRRQVFLNFIFSFYLMFIERYYFFFENKNLI